MMSDVVQLWLASFYGCMGFLMPYFNMILAHYGYNGWQIGVISAIRPLASALCGPVWAGLADYYSEHRRILLSCLVLSSVVLLDRSAIYVCSLFSILDDMSIQAE